MKIMPRWREDLQAQVRYYIKKKLLVLGRFIFLHYYSAGAVSLLSHQNAAKN